MQATRRKEQRLAAMLGRYSFLAQLQFASAEIRCKDDRVLVGELSRIFKAARPEVVMTHNVIDRHPTHVATAIRVIEALRTLPPDARPKTLYGGEAWRGLDWLSNADKVRLDASGHDSLASALMGCFDSQIAGGKRYDVATFGRWRTNATHDDSHAVDTSVAVAFAMDMTALIADDALTAEAFVERKLAAFAREALGEISKSKI